MIACHTFPDCTGRWRPKRGGEDIMSWRCDACRARIPHTDAVGDAALAENRLGTLLRDLTRQGGRLLRRGDGSAA
ncbi:MAG: hypothetical protein JWM27_861 [Gemmatimonadetes bacterium]|nr:hypothetical protein [Gemmatimonadota bacterium]